MLKDAKVAWQHNQVNKVMRVTSQSTQEGIEAVTHAIGAQNNLPPRYTVIFQSGIN